MEKETTILGAIMTTIEGVTGMDFVWFVVLAIFVMVEIILRLIPTTKESSVLNKFLYLVQNIVNYLIPDRVNQKSKKDGI